VRRKSKRRIQRRSSHEVRAAPAALVEGTLARRPAQQREEGFRRLGFVGVRERAARRDLDCRGYKREITDS
jgi:hypothetical protein